MSTKKLIRIATRKSKLALWQAEYVKQALLNLFSKITVEIHGLITSGDKYQSGPLSEVGDKSLFVKELEMALLNNEADIAVHSMKDVPMEIPSELTIAAICKREDPRDVLISAQHTHLNALPANARVGTSSLRRICQLKALRNDLDIQVLRGNVDTRLQRLEEGRYDAIVLAAAGLLRLGLESRISEYFSLQDFIPAVGQGALGIECRANDIDTISYINKLNNSTTSLCVNVERTIATLLDAGCHVPMGVYAHTKMNDIDIQAMVGDPDNLHIIHAKGHDSIANANQLAHTIANDLLKQGADKILQRYARSGKE